MTKRIIALALVCVMCLCLFACSSKEADLYNKYKDIIDALEEEDYQSAYLAMVELANKAETDENGDTTPETTDPAIEAFQASLVGNWIPRAGDADEFGAVSFEITADGKLVMGDETYPLEVEYEYADSVDYNINDGDTKLYSLDIYIDEDDAYCASFSKYDEEEGYYEGIGTYYLESQYIKVELTADNFSDYFEESEEYVVLNENSFGETTSFWVNRDMMLKSEYGKVNSELSHVALEYSYTSKPYEYTADIENATHEIGAEVEGYDPEEGTSVVTLGNYCGENNDRYGFDYISYYMSNNEGTVWIYSDFGIVRIQGTIYIFNAE